ncbi:uncharacterized protein PAC_08140 [Phialocephala subalpina]|uniref:Uncharacterized protein n=1 Tax=Phialocephala subalpina TaxID=576137 RepID=A0A1L7WZP6_9HELO|nr:uncharacterized protein PAC_08140 [Phialocephala subalpina]
MICGGGKGGGGVEEPPRPVRLDNVDPVHADAPRPKTQSRATESRSRKVEPSGSSSQPGSKPPPSSSHREKGHSTSSPSPRKDARPHSSSHKDARPYSSSHKDARPYSSSHKDARPRHSSHRPSTSARERERTSHRPSGSQRPTPIEPIPENRPVQYTQGKTIIDRVAELYTLIDQHAENFYSRDEVPGKSLESELNDPATRHAIIRQRIARTIIDKIVISLRDSSDADMQNIATELSDQFTLCAIADRNSQREGHISELCNIGAELRRLMSSHPSTWDFGGWGGSELQSRGGVIIAFPALLQDEEQVAPRRIFRV